MKLKYFLGRKRVLTNIVKGDQFKYKKHENICIVGAGPSGMLLSLILSKYGVLHTLIDRKLEPTNHPQAHFINARSMEILRDFLKPDTFKKMISASPSFSDWRYAYLLLYIGLIWGFIIMS